MKKKTDYFDLILKIIIVLLTILIVYWFFQLMFGGSPSLTQFNNGLILILVGLVVQLYYKFGKFSQFMEGVFPRFENNVENSFNRMKEDMGLIKKKLKI